MGKIFFTGDMHFGHEKAIAFDNRPFQTVEEMDAELIRRWNRKVGPEDTVYVLGDLIWKSRNKDAAGIIRSLNGRIVLIKGNHDIFIRDDEAREALAEVKDYDDIYVTLEDGSEKRCILSHYFIPMYDGHWHGAIHLHAHSHFSDEADLEVDFAKTLFIMEVPNEIYNVGCMYWGYEPVTLDEIIAHGSTVRPDYGKKKGWIDLQGDIQEKESKKSGSKKMNIYAMSDIHGCLEEFEEALSLVDLSGDNMLILLGDYIHGGPESYGVLDKIIDLEKEYGKDKVVALLGNHEEMAMDGMWPIGQRGYERLDYDEADDEPYLLWMQGLPRYYATERQIFCHAGVDEDAGDLWKWGTGDYIFTEKYQWTTGRFCMDIIAGHVGTAQISGDPRFHDIYLRWGEPLLY